jgi:hypothetical protein
MLKSSNCVYVHATQMTFKGFLHLRFGAQGYVVFVVLHVNSMLCNAFHHQEMHKPHDVPCHKLDYRHHGARQPEFD